MTAESLSLSSTRRCCPALEREGIVLRGLKDLTEADRRHLSGVFRREIFPVLTPLAIDPGHPFPHLLNKSLNLAVLLQRPGDAEKLFAVVQVPAVLPRFVAAARSERRAEPSGPRHVFTPLETVIRLHLPELFPGMTHRTRRRLPRHAQQRHSRSTTTKSKTCSRPSRRRCASGGAARRCACKSRPTPRRRSSSF